MVDPVVASKAAMEQYDKNGDGLLDQTELKACPALLANSAHMMSPRIKNSVRTRLEHRSRRCTNADSG